MYCSAPLAAAPAEELPAPLSAEELQAKGDRARQLLDSLRPEARALMPPEVLETLRADAGLGSSAPPAPAPPQPPRPALPRAARGPRRRPSPRSTIGPTTLEELPLGSLEALDELSPANQQEGQGSWQAFLLDALGRGGGPFGPRQAPWRLVMLPDPAYRGQLPWLRPRLASTVGIDAYTAAQYLQRPVPSFLASADTARGLEEQAQHLADAGLRVLLLPRRDWASDRLPQLVSGVEDLDSDPLVFTLSEGAPLRVRRADLTWAATAEIHPVRDASGGVEIKRTRWGMPVLPERVGLADRFTPYFVLDICRSDSPRPLRIRSAAFDFRRLGADRAIAAAVNIRRLAERLAGPAGMPVDEGFRKVTSNPGPRDQQDGADADVTLPRRELDFTEYVLLLDARYHAGR